MAVADLTHWHRMMERFYYRIHGFLSRGRCPRSLAGLWLLCKSPCNLHALAVEIASRNPPCLPSNPQDLQDLPGIGPYTAAAVSSIAFDYPIAAVDGNIRRIYARNISRGIRKTVISRHGLTNPCIEAVQRLESGLNGTRCNNLHASGSFL